MQMELQHKLYSTVHPYEKVIYELGCKIAELFQFWYVQIKCLT